MVDVSCSFGKGSCSKEAEFVGDSLEVFDHLDFGRKRVLDFVDGAIHLELELRIHKDVGR